MQITIFDTKIEYFLPRKNLPIWDPISLPENPNLPIWVQENITCMQRLTSSWRHVIKFTTVHLTGDDVNFCDDQGMLIHKTEKLCIKARELPC